MEAAPEMADLAYEVPEMAAAASEPMMADTPAFQPEIDRSAESFPARPADTLQRPAPQMQAPVQQQAAVQPPMPQATVKKAFSLFERVTGAVRRAEAAAAQPPAPPAQRMIPTLGAPAPTRPSMTESNIAPVGGQPRLGIDAPARPKVSTPEDDLLEIPAFLRRQAN